MFLNLLEHFAACLTLAGRYLFGLIYERSDLAAAGGSERSDDAGDCAENTPAGDYRNAA
jgi:hypothetical protein